MFYSAVCCDIVALQKLEKCDSNIEAQEKATFALSILENRDKERNTQMSGLYDKD